MEMEAFTDKAQSRRITSNDTLRPFTQQFLFIMNVFKFFKQSITKLSIHLIQENKWIN